MISLPLVYLVDDGADYRFLVKAIFDRYFPAYSLHLFTSGAAFLAALPQLDDKPNLILLDQHMPQFSGYQTLLALKRQVDYRSVPIVMMSADASGSEVSSFYQAGASSFLRKQLDFDAARESLLAACQYASQPR